MFQPATTPATTELAANAWAQVYTNYAVAGGVQAALGKRSALAQALKVAFDPELLGAGLLLLLEALQVFWLGLPVPAQTGVVTAFIPVSVNLNTNLPPNATAPQQAAALAQKIARLTLSAVKVTVPGPAVVPLL